MKRSIWIIIVACFILSAAGFVYTFVQPRWTATITKVGRAKSVESFSRRRHRSRSYTVVPLTVTYTDGSGENQTALVHYPRPSGPLEIGQQIVITRSFNGLIPYPFIGLRLFCGVLAGGIGLFLLFTWMDRKKKP